MIRFSKYIWLYMIISGLVLVPGFYSILRYGFKQSIDFSGGTLVEYRTSKPIAEEAFRTAAKQNDMTVVNIQQAGDKGYLIRMKPETNKRVEALTASLQTNNAVTATVVRNETVGPVLGKELLSKTLFAALLAISAILAYVAYAFKNIRFGIAAILALMHDLLVVLGCFSLFGHFFGVEIDTLFVTAFLTTMSFSVHDTIVVFDRIREYSKRDRTHSLEEISDIALTETMNRSVTNSFTIVFMLVALVLMGGESIKWFAVALLIGTVSGTYSSPFVATPVLVLWHRYDLRKKKA